ncbi:deubiquitinase OTUD6B-like isoform X2 [Portunus trituberculatus]|uniref:deubiquitinase OTUD6B-like isoform X2 n=1 Tax=Portunus trituberculatus TaxID=210409 RepID=UPI001E1CCB3D|nr:deubiquitinase OTUD6B-like isoform X2 [Portunus trituberculatus]
MSEEEDCQELSAEEELAARHRKEKKELQAKVQQMKKMVNKDKKKKKEVLEEITQLEKDLKQRHAEELALLKASEETVTDVGSEVAVLSLEEEEEEEGVQDNEASSPPQEGKPTEKKVSKAEKRRKKKAEANREREARIKEEMANNKNCARNVEAEKLKELLRERQLKMHEIEPDGNCMYAAIAHQAGNNTTVPGLRAQAGQFIRSNFSDFAPFITDPKTGEMLTPEQFSEYCDLIVKTPAWGGQPELRALSQVLHRRIEVLQAEGSPIVFGEDWTQHKTIHLAYYRHYYGLGEHYNSVTPLNPVEA